MPATLEAPLRGTICALARFSNCAVVKLDEPFHGKQFAVINMETRGRIALASTTKDGKLPLYAKVCIDEAEEGSEALRALSVFAVKGPA